MPEARSKGHVGTDATRIYQRSVTEPPGLLQKLASELATLDKGKWQIARYLHATATTFRLGAKHDVLAHEFKICREI